MSPPSPLTPLCPPKDHHSLVLLATGCLGVSMLLPMNFYFNADDYWKYKFRNTSLAEDEWGEGELTAMQTFWGANISTVSMAPNFLFLLLNVLYGQRLPVRPRILLPLLLNVVLFALSSLFTQLDTDTWQPGFYGLTLAFALLFNISDSVYQGAFTSAIGRFPAKYMGAMMQGQAVGGVLSSGCSVLLLFTGADKRYFRPVGVFLLYNCLDFLGRSLSTVLPALPPLLTLLLAALRLSFIPLFLFCNISPSSRHVTSVLFPSDTVFLVLHTVFSLSSGFLTNTAMMTGPQLVEGEARQSLAASIMVFCLVLGLLLGALSSYLWVKLL